MQFTLQQVLSRNHPCKKSVCGNLCRGVALENQNRYHAQAAFYLEPRHLLPDFSHDLLADVIPPLDLNHVNSVPRLQEQVYLATL